MSKNLGTLRYIPTISWHYRFSLEEKQSAMRDFMKKEKVLRSESKLAEMVDLIGPKGRVG